MECMCLEASICSVDCLYLPPCGIGGYCLGFQYKLSWLCFFFGTKGNCSTSSFSDVYYTHVYMWEYECFNVTYMVMWPCWKLLFYTFLCVRGTCLQWSIISCTCVYHLSIEELKPRCPGRYLRVVSTFKMPKYLPVYLKLNICTTDHALPTNTPACTFTDVHVCVCTLNW